MHVRSVPVDPRARTDAVTRKLTKELLLPYQGLPDDHLPAEQIASVALREIEGGNSADGALWLGIASYRYHQEALDAARRGAQDAPSPQFSSALDRAAYDRFVSTEIRRYAYLGFGLELRLLSARATGQTDREKALQQQVAALGKTTEIEQESLREAIWELRPTGTTNRATGYPELLEAFRSRLRRDASVDREDEHPSFYLSTVPFPQLQGEAILATTSFFDPPVCAGVAAAFPFVRPTVLRYLGAPQMWTRANAAATLALAPSDETRAALEARLAAETEPRVRLALAYALVHHGVDAQTVTLTAALASCEGAGCTLPVMLAQWLPPSAKLEVQQQLIARILNGNQFQPRAHLFAAALARDIGQRQALDAATVEALIVAARRKGPPDEGSAADVAFDAIAGSEALSHAEVVARLEGHDQSSAARRPDVLMPAPLLARLARISIADDLPLLRRMMSRFGDFETPEAGLIVAAALHIPGEQADARLINWLNRYPLLATQIALGLLGRATVPRAQLESAVARASVFTQLLVKKVSHAPDADATLLGYLRDRDLGRSLAAAEIAGLTGQVSAVPDLWTLVSFRDARYYPNDAIVRHVGMQALVRIALGLTAAAPTASAP
jgi:hypothetical protein